MKKTLNTLVVALAALPMLATAASKTHIIETKIDYARALEADDRTGFAVYMAAIGGHVKFEGAAPVWATLKVGGQIYTAPTDKDGNYSFFVYTDGYNRFSVEGWCNDDAPANPPPPGHSKDAAHFAEGILKR